jgi:hypothetical protein
MAYVFPRIHVILAKAAPLGVVIRRSPSRFVATLCWKRKTDEFQLGQWLKGRIYERRCDLSPDGQYLLYFAMNGKWDSEARGAWTAISRAPYLKALGLFPKGDCWHGGGLWTGDRTYWLNDGYGHEVLRDTNEVQRDLEYFPTENYGGECPGVYYPRLLRDGWQLREQSDGVSSNDMVIFEKQCPHDWILRKVAHAQVGAPPGKGCYWDQHELVHPRLNRKLPCYQWEWADLDGERLVWAAEGRLSAAHLCERGLVDEKILYDFNEMAFEPIEAPY